MKTTVFCPCGVVIKADSEDELVTQVLEHLRKEHPGREYTREQILSMAV